MSRSLAIRRSKSSASSGERRENHMTSVAAANRRGNLARVGRLGEPLDEVERRLGDLLPAVVDRQGVGDLPNANLAGANLLGAYLRGAIFCHTTMPDGSINNTGC